MTKTNIENNTEEKLREAEQEREKLKQEIAEELNEEWKEREWVWKYQLEQKEEELEMKKREIEEILKFPGTPPTPPETPVEEKKLEVLAQDWLERNYGKDKEKIDKIGENEPWMDVKLVGELEIKDYPNLKLIELREMGITKLTIINCPQVEEIDVYDNQITEIVGLEQLSKLKCLSVCENELSGLDIGENLELVGLYCHTNPYLSRIDGIMDIANLCNFARGSKADKIPFNFPEEQKRKLIEVNGELISSGELVELQTKPVKEVRKVMKDKVHQLTEVIKKVLNIDPSAKLEDNPTWKEDLIARVKELEKLAKVEKERDELKKEIKKIKDEVEKSKKFETMLKLTEDELESMVGDWNIKKVRKEVERKIEEQDKESQTKLEANIEVNTNNNNK